MLLIAASAIWLSACGTGPEGTARPDVGWGPLAVARDYVGSELLGTAGTIRITADCALLDKTNGGTYLLVWWQSSTQWDGARQVIRHKHNNGVIEEFRSGDQVALGGSRGSTPDWSDFLSSRAWTAEPHEVCNTGTVWYIDEVGKL